MDDLRDRTENPKKKGKKNGLLLPGQQNIKKRESERQSWEGWCQKAYAQRDLGQDSPKNRGHVWLMILKIILK